MEPMELLLNFALAALVGLFLLPLFIAAREGGSLRDRFAEAFLAFGNELGAYGLGYDTIEIWFVVTLTSTTAPSAAQINAGTRLTDDIVEVSGLTTTANYRDVPTLKGGTPAKLVGRSTLDDTAITFAEHTTWAGNTIKQALTEGLSGYLVTARYKKGAVAATDRVSVWPSRIGSNDAANWPVEDEELRFRVSVGITLPPSKDVAAAA